MSKISEISSSLSIFKRATAVKTENSASSFASNPFGISFKGKALSMDAFVSSTKEQTPSFKENIQQKGKLFASAVVTNMTNFKNSFTEKLQPVINFGKKAKENISNLWNKMNSYEIKMPSFNFGSEGKINELTKLPVSELEEQLSSHIAALS